MPVPIVLWNAETAESWSGKIDALLIAPDTKTVAEWQAEVDMLNESWEDYEGYQLSGDDAEYAEWENLPDEGKRAWRAGLAAWITYHFSEIQDIASYEYVNAWL